VKTYLELHDVELMEHNAKSLRDRLLVRLLFHLGCRISELLAIKLSDIDFQRGTITIIHLKTRLRLTCTKCKASLARRHQFCPECGEEVRETKQRLQEHRRIRVLPVDSASLQLIRDYLHSKTSANNMNTRLFKLNRHRAWQIVRDCARRAGISPLVNPETGKVRGVSPHRLRDAFSVHAMKRDDSGDALRLLQEHLGHASFNTTAKYRKVAGQEHRKWYDNLWQK
jgi:integrase/recombinase XerD